MGDFVFFFFFQAEDGIRDLTVTGVQTCALPIYYLGFKVNSGEYKVMGLAPYGEPKYAALIRDNLLELKPDGSFRLNLAYFDYCTGLRMTNSKFADLMRSEEHTSELQSQSISYAV